ncbi:hypothetical protein [Amycolatopsis sp. WQ 127309]|uniref:hypothetical protein n=1 Tax=Amycolatopsis sp. WQ 127309 TaxID=2932773 RepID=UPI001FF249BE|nr:hypothetical protein [Amycolatopsis sp. WQ 127309]UOZ07959.1 hypothetical protein MUY22_06660 [Amycolatopsis sp. WQ 127309]
MAYHNGIIEITRQLEHVLARMGAADATKLRSLLGAFATSVEENRDQLASDIATLVMPWYEPGEPIYEALNETRYAEVRQAPVVALFLVRLALGLPAADDPRERILGIQQVTTATELRRRGADPDVRDLIRLPRPDGSVSVPDFQFDADLRPRSVVLEVNRVLGADDDPWAVADWWVSGNIWLDAVPVTLLSDNVVEPGLVAAATAAVDG